MNEKPQYDFGSELRLSENDVIWFHFVANGDEGDKFIKIYRSHVVDAVSKNGKNFTDYRYCPSKSGENRECPLCEAGHDTIKERMSMWFYVYYILHATLPAEKNFPRIEYEGRIYFQEEVNGFRIWNASAWRESPWNDINKLAHLYKGLHNFQAQIVTVGRDLSRRFKLYAIPNSTSLPPEIYERAQTECEPIGNLLEREVNTPVQIRPKSANGQQSQDQSIRPFVPPGMNVPSFTGMPSPSTGMPSPSVPASTAADEDDHRPIKSLF